MGLSTYMSVLDGYIGLSIRMSVLERVHWSFHLHVGFVFALRLPL